MERENRDRRICLRFYTSDYRAVLREAEKAGMTFSEYVRRSALLAAGVEYVYDPRSRSGGQRKEAV